MNIMDRPHVVVHVAVSNGHAHILRIIGPFPDGYAAREATTRLSLAEKREKHYYNFHPLEED